MHYVNPRKHAQFYVVSQHVCRHGSFRKQTPSNKQIFTLENSQRFSVNNERMVTLTGMINGFNKLVS